MNLQRIFSIDNRMIQEVIEKVNLESLEALRKKDNLSKDFNMIIDAILPTESGLLPPHLPPEPTGHLWPGPAQHQYEGQKHPSQDTASPLILLTSIKT
jgi:hypothetical protein